MYLTTHATVAILLARVIPNPILAFIAGFISHYILDAIPHDNIIKDQKTKNKIRSGEVDFKTIPEFKLFLILFSIDLIILILLCFFIFYRNLETNPTSTGAAIFGAVLPDFLWGTFAVTKWKIFKIFERINSWVHGARKDIIPTWLGTALQTAFVVVVLYLIYLR